MNGDFNPVGFSIDRGFCLGRGESKTEIREVIRERFRCLGDFVGVVGFAGSDLDQGFELILLFQVVALHTDLGNHKALTLGDVDGDDNFLLVGRDGDLGGVHLELQVALRQVIRAQGLHIRIEFATHVAVGLGIPAQPGSGIQIKKIQQRTF